jgi:hypothetical protein
VRSFKLCRVQFVQCVMSSLYHASVIFCCHCCRRVRKSRMSDAVANEEGIVIYGFRQYQILTIRIKIDRENNWHDFHDFVHVHAHGFLLTKALSPEKSQQRKGTIPPAVRFDLLEEITQGCYIGINWRYICLLHRQVAQVSALLFIIL